MSHATEAELAGSDRLLRMLMPLQMFSCLLSDVSLRFLYMPRISNCIKFFRLSKCRLPVCLGSCLRISWFQSFLFVAVTLRLFYL